jgi:hypothetical protein
MRSAWPAARRTRASQCAPRGDSDGRLAPLQLGREAADHADARLQLVRHHLAGQPHRAVDGLRRLARQVLQQAVQAPRARPAPSHSTWPEMRTSLRVPRAVVRRTSASNTPLASTDCSTAAISCARSSDLDVVQCLRQPRRSAAGVQAVDERDLVGPVQGQGTQVERPGAGGRERPPR